MRILFLSCLCCSAIALFSQKPPDCQEMLNQARTFERQNELSKAVQSYLNALNCNSTLGNEIGPRLKAVFEKIEAQKDNEQKAKQVAEERLVSIQKQAKEIQAQTMASQANSLMTEGRFYEAMAFADQANELVPSGDMQALMMRAYEALQQPGAARLIKYFTTPFRNISQLFYNQAAGVLIATDQEAGASALYDLSGDTIKETPLPGITIEVVFSPNNKRFIVVNHKNKVTLWSADCKQIAELSVIFFNEKCKIEFSPCSQYLLYENGFSGILWSLDGLNLVDGADTLRPLFTEAFFDPARPGSSRPRFCSIDHKTFLQTYGGTEKDSTLWDIGLLLQGYKKESIVTKWMDAPVNNPKPDSLPVVKILWPKYFSLSVSANSPVKYLFMAERFEDTKPLGIIKRDHSIVAYTFGQVVGGKGDNFGQFLANPYEKPAETLATAAENGEIALWQFNWSLGFEKTFKDKCVARVDPKSEKVLVLEKPFKVHLLDLQGHDLFQRPVYHYDNTPLLNDGIFSAGSKLLLTCFGNTWSVHDMEGKLLYARQFSRPYAAPVFTSDGKSILYGAGAKLFKMSISGFKTTCIFNGDTTIQKVIESSDTNAIWLWMADSTTSILNINGELVRRFPKKVNQGRFSPAGHFFIEEIGDTAVILYTSAGKQVRFPEQVRWIDFSPDDRFLYINFIDGKSELRSEDGVVLKRIPREIECVFSPGSKFVLLYDEPGGVLQVMNLEKGTIVNVTLQGKLISCAFSPDGRFFALAFDNNTVEVLETNGDFVATIPELGSVRFSPGSNYILIQKNYDVSFFTAKGIKISVLKSNGHSIPDFNFSPDDKWVIISDFSGDVNVMPTPLGIHSYLNSNFSTWAKSNINNRY